MAIAEGQLQELQIGDIMRYKMVVEGTDYDVDIEVTGEETSDGKDSFVVNITSTLPPMDLSVR